VEGKKESESASRRYLGRTRGEKKRASIEE
jgi:hypothetical protein